MAASNQQIRKQQQVAPLQTAGWVRGLSSQMASLVSVTVCFPLEVIKTRMQIQVRTLLCLSPASSFQLQGGRGVNHFGLSSLLFVAKQEGLKGLYRGYSVTAFCSPMFNAMYFPMYEGFKKHFRESFELEEGSFRLYGCSAVASGLISNVITNPFWMVRTRMQAETFRSMCEQNYRSKYSLNLFKNIWLIWQREGFFTLYNGLSASMLGVMHPLIYFPLYEKSKIYFKEHWDGANPDPHHLSSQYILVSTVVCKGITSAMTYPHEVLRARMQDVRLYERSRKVGFFECAGMIWREKGLLSFYDGFVVNLMRISPSYAITFVLYEKFSVEIHRAFQGPAKFSTT